MSEKGKYQFRLMVYDSEVNADEWDVGLRSLLSSEEVAVVRAKLAELLELKEDDIVL